MICDMTSMPAPTCVPLELAAYVSVPEAPPWRHLPAGVWKESEGGAFLSEPPPRIAARSSLRSPPPPLTRAAPPAGTGGDSGGGGGGGCGGTGGTGGAGGAGASGGGGNGGNGADGGLDSDCAVGRCTDAGAAGGGGCGGRAAGGVSSCHPSCVAAESGGVRRQRAGGPIPPMLLGKELQSTDSPRPKPREASDAMGGSGVSAGGGAGGAADGAAAGAAADTTAAPRRKSAARWSSSEAADAARGGEAGGAEWLLAPSLTPLSCSALVTWRCKGWGWGGRRERGGLAVCVCVCACQVVGVVGGRQVAAAPASSRRSRAARRPASAAARRRAALAAAWGQAPRPGTCRTLAPTDAPARGDPHGRRGPGACVRCGPWPRGAAARRSARAPTGASAARPREGRCR